MTAPLRSGDPITVNVALGDRAYDIAIGRGLLATLGERIAKLRPGCKVAIVTDATVAQHHLAAAEASLSGAGIASSSVKVPAGESSKSFRHFEQVCDALLAAKIERGDLVVALGGGVVGDLGGFCARGGAPRRRLRAGADDAAGAGRFLGRRQDRDQFPPRQEPDRRVLPADPGGGRHGACSTRCRSASSAPAMPRR